MQSPATATVTQRRPQFFRLDGFLGGRTADAGARTEISAEATMEAHYPDYLQ